MRIAPTLLSAALVAGLAGLSGATAEAATPVHFTSAHGTFTGYAPGAHAVTYRADLVPGGAQAHVFGTSARATGTTTVLVVTGLLPNHQYGAHAHANACGPTGDDAGPHFQHTPDPVKPSIDPAYANSRNEIWLDFTTDRFGTGHAKSTVDWKFGSRRAHSVVIHETHTHTDPGHAGTAGARLACLDVGF
ncbi:superoxide dismutase [Amycolatopsis sp. NPDC005232]|uniref:superoxide dismutase n=1 Tax=Amycolatopsis sp. NPDC005232 TaxID=3157027 RepID=UPI0033BE80C8